MPVPGTPNGGCNYHCSATDLSVHSPTKQEEPFGILHQKLRPLIAEQKGGGGGGQCAKRRKNVPKRVEGNGNDSRPDDVLCTPCVDVRCTGVGFWSVRRWVTRPCFAKANRPPVSTCLDTSSHRENFLPERTEKVTLVALKWTGTWAPAKEEIIKAHFEGLN